MEIRVHVERDGSPLTPGFATHPGPGNLPCVTIEAFDSSRFNEWNEIVNRIPGAVFFHGSAWMEMLQASYGFRPMGLVFRRGGAVVGLLPVVEVRSRLSGCRGVSLPFADECPPLVRSGDRTENFLHAMVEFTRAQGWDFFEIRGSHESLRPEIPAIRYCGHRIDLARDPRSIWNGLKGSVRTGIRKAEAAGVTVEFSTSLDALRSFFGLYRLTRRRHGLPPQPFSFFQAIHDRILAAGNGQIVLARASGRCLAGAVFLHQGGRVLFKYGASDAKYQSFRANNLVMWSSINHYSAISCNSISLGRTSQGNEGLRRFKQGWASAEYPIEYAKYDMCRNQFVEDADMTTGWHNRALRATPCWISALVGKLLYKHWA